jgi:N-acetylated-alpha-linked acidic dipeptidase
VQRGSVQFLSLCPGDPSTPGYASKPGVNRTDPHDYIPSIPSLPISFRDALPLLKSLNNGKFCGNSLGENWAGALEGVDYCVESQNHPAVNLVNEVEFVYTPIYNVVGRIPGKTSQEVILGNHRDAWVYGAGDPSSGSAALNAVVKGFGRLVAEEWKPYRTLVFASWDAEEYGLVGSTEWVEDHANHLTKAVLAYLNVDVAAVGDALHIQASPLLDDVVMQATKDIVTDTGRTIHDNWKNTSNDHAEIGHLGSGSDYTAFLQLYGIASLDLGFRPRTAVYHCTAVSIA